MPASPTVRNPITGATPARLQRRGQGFSLVETLVVIGIISILVSLVVASGFYLNGRAKQSQTRGILAALAAIDTEYRAQTGKAINHTGTDPMDWGQSYTTKYANGATYTGVSLETGTNINYSIERFIIAAKQVSQTASMIDNLANNMADTEKASDGSPAPNGLYEIVDGWGNAIAYRSQESSTGTFPAHPTPFFVSAGPDGKFGSSNPSIDDDAKDNFYSYDLE